MVGLLAHPGPAVGRPAPIAGEESGYVIAKVCGASRLRLALRNQFRGARLLSVKRTVIDMNNRGFPSLAALLGLLAIAGYQNRDKLTELLRGAQTKSGTSPGGSPEGQAATTGNLGGLLGGTSVGGLLGSGLRDLIDSFKSSGQGEIADSWVRTGPNKPVSPQELERAIGPEILATLSEQTGLSKQELLSRLSRELPEAVDKYTPEGRLPAPA
jgi:uncharacterized protein YidB (DUF937 family)